MKIVFFGTSRFAIPSFDKLISAKLKPELLITQPDRPRGRHLNTVSSAIKERAEKERIKVMQPDLPESADGILRELKPDLFVVISYGRILKESTLNIPAKGSLNLHPSLLPKYRGPAPINRALINGEKTTGVTVIKLSPGIDSGPVMNRTEAEIDSGDTAETLEKRLAQIGADLLIDTIKNLDSITPLPQNEEQVSYAPKLTKEEGRIDWNLPAEDILRRIRGLSPWPGTYTTLNGKTLKIHSASLCQADPAADTQPGRLTITSSRLLAGTGMGVLVLEEVQLEGKRRMTAAEFIRGFRENFAIME